MSLVARVKRSDGTTKEIRLAPASSVSLGRDSLGVADKRCSRKQVELSLRHDGSVALTVLGMNPVFVDAKEGKKMINQHEKATLHAGDTFYLVANEHPVELIATPAEAQAVPVKPAAAVLPVKEEKKQKKEEDAPDAQQKPAEKPRRLLMEDTDEDEGLWSAAVKASKKQSLELEEGAKKKQSAPPKRSTTADDEALARAIAAAEEEDAPQRQRGKQGKGSGQSSGKNLKRHVSDAYDVYNHESDQDYAAPVSKVPTSPTSSIKTRKKQDSNKPVCKFGSACYRDGLDVLIPSRKNPDHIREFYHPKPGTSNRSASEAEEDNDVVSD